ncbi:MAG: hypothetical protein MUF52_03245 [Syntrophobacteraceae bacterium]|nr:hypothetical protein [Syntrophobacteraceae bacterium]
MIEKDTILPDQGARKIVALTDVWAQHLSWVKDHKKSFDTGLAYCKKRLEPRYGRKALDDITPLDIEGMKSEMKKNLRSSGGALCGRHHQASDLPPGRLFNLAR